MKGKELVLVMSFVGIFCYGYLDLFATGVESPVIRGRSPLYVPPPRIIEDSVEVRQQKEEIKSFLYESLQRCLKYRVILVNRSLNEKQLKQLEELKLKIESLKDDLESEEIQEKLHLKSTGFLERCDEVLQEVALIENWEAGENKSNSQNQKRNSKYLIASGVALACLGNYVLKKNNDFKIKESNVTAPGVAPLTEEEKKARAKKNAIPFLKKYKPTEFKDAVKLGIAVAAIICGITL